MSLPHMNRRALFGASAVSALAIRPAVAASSEAKTIPAIRFFADEGMNFSASFAVGESAYGAGEVGEVIAAVNAINEAGASYQTFTDAFLALARRVERIASDALAAGHKTSARPPSCVPRNTTIRRCSLSSGPAHRSGGGGPSRHAAIVERRHPALRAAVRAGEHSV